MSEASMWSTVRSTLTGLDPVRVENRIELGTPDVNLAPGQWIELKWCRKAPKRGGIVTIEHYTQEQRTWATRRTHAGGKVWLLLCIEKEWILFRGIVAVEYLNKVDLEKLRGVAEKVWPGKLNKEEFRKILLEK